AGLETRASQARLTLGNPGVRSEKAEHARREPAVPQPHKHWTKLHALTDGSALLLGAERHIGHAHGARCFGSVLPRVHIRCGDTERPRRHPRDDLGDKRHSSPRLRTIRQPCALAPSPCPPAPYTITPPSPGSPPASRRV